MFNCKFFLKKIFVEKEPQYLTEKILEAVIEECQVRGSWSKLIHLIGSVFNNPESLIKSFRKDLTYSTASSPLDRASVSSAEVATDSADVTVKYPVQESQADSLAPAGNRDLNLTVDLSSLRCAYQHLMSVPEQCIQGPLINALISLSQTVEMEVKYKNVLEREPHYINIFVVVMEIPMLLSPEYLDSAFPAVCKAIGMLGVPGQAQLARIWATYGHNRLKDMVLSLQQLITIKVMCVDLTCKSGKSSGTYIL